MVQRDITSFFVVGKRKAVKDEPKDLSKQRKIDEKLSRQQKHASLVLNSYAKGNPVSSDFHASEFSKDRHQKFYDRIAGSRKAIPSDSNGRNLKPWDLQYIDLKSQKLDAIMLIQNGYKYHIMGEDAYKVARFLGRSPVNGWRTLHYEGDPRDVLYDRFASLTFPVERLRFYIEKLVQQGFKVAVVKQIETPALKAMSDNKRGPIRREVTDIYTKGTLVEEFTSSSVVNGHLLTLKSTKKGFALIAVQPATGSGFYDKFQDSGAGMELETRLLHIQPSELLTVGELTGVALRMVKSLDIPMKVCEETSNADIDAPDFIIKDGDLADCWSVICNHLTECNLGEALKLGLKPFTLSSFMQLNGDTLNSLEIYTNQTTHEKRGSLMWALDSTKTSFGRRRLRSWLGRPLLDRELLAERIEAMEEIMHAEGDAISLFNRLKTQLGKTPDLERYTYQIYHGRIGPQQLYWCLYWFNQLISCITEPEIAAAKLKSPLLQEILSSLKPVRSIVEQLFKKITKPTNDHPDLSEYFRYKILKPEEMGDDIKAIKDLASRISKCRQDFLDYLINESQNLDIPLKQVNAFGEEDTFVIGVAKSKASKVPASWRRQGAITNEIRFWSPFSLEQTKILKPLLEEQALVSQQAYRNFLKDIAQNHFDDLRAVVSSLATLDCLLSNASVSLRPGYVKPDIVDESCLEIEEGRHPVLDQLTMGNSIPNDTHMYSTKNRCMIITGANMGGKSSYVRQTALIVIMAQIGCYVPAKKARFSIMDAVYTRMGAFDNLLRGESTFMVELKECSAILNKATPRSLVIMDEIGRGTSTMDGVAIAEAVLHYMIENVKAFTLFITHYPLLCEKANEFPAVENWSMDCALSEDNVIFLYKIVPNHASKSYGINVARLAGLDQSILKNAELKSSEFEKDISSRRDSSALLGLVCDILSGKGNLELLAKYIYPVASNTVGEICDSQAQ